MMSKLDHIYKQLNISKSESQDPKPREASSVVKPEKQIISKMSKKINYKRQKHAPESRRFLSMIS